MTKSKGGLRTTKTCSLLSMLSLTSSFFLVEIIVGYITGSVALIADSFHMLSDVISLIVGFLALRYSKKTKKNQRNTFGWQRAEVLGALINAVFLVALCFTILIEALKRMVEIEEIENPWLVLIVGAVGLAVNLLGLGLLHGHGHSHGGGGHGHGHRHGHSHGAISNGNNPANQTEMVINNTNTLEDGSVIDLSGDLGQNAFSDLYLKDAHEIQKFATVIVREKSVDVPECSSDQEKDKLNKGEKVTTSAQMNMRAVYLHVLGDALGSVIVIASALCIIFGEGEWTLYVDPLMSIILVIIIMRSSIPLLKESALILMQTVPTHIKIQEVQERLLEQVEGVLSLHEFHVWQLAGDKIIASAHITCRSMAEYMPIANKVKDFFHNEGIHSTTIQPEFVEDPAPELQKLDGCVLDCGNDKDCGAQRCCPDDVRLRKVTQAESKDGASTSADESDGPAKPNPTRV